VYTSSIAITGVDTTGTVAYYPSTVSSSANIVVNNATNVTTQGAYTQTDWVGPAPVLTTQHGLTDEISITSTSGSTVYFKTVANVQN
jgi:hypothetical protein